jgi:RNA polymerase sigma factor (sigma-70 family)
MTLITITDEFLATRAADGDEAAFTELARRYYPLLCSASRRPPAGVDAEDLRQEALLGLLETCHKHDPARGRFASLARCNVRQRVIAASIRARTLKHRMLTEALHDHDDGLTRLSERLPASAGSDPALVVELRDELRERAQAARKVDRRRRYTAEQSQRAVALIAAGKTPKEAAFAVGATTDAVHKWLRSAGQTPVAARRHFTTAEIDEAVARVQEGATLREAAVAVGTTGPTVLRWLRRAGHTPARPRRAAFTPEKVREAVALVDSGATLREAAAVVGTTHSTVHKWVRKAA